jgi:hypothetical protein
MVAPPPASPKVRSPRKGGGAGSRAARDKAMIAIVLSCLAIAIARRAARGRTVLLGARAT